MDDTPMFNHIISSVDPLLIKKWIKMWLEDSNKKKETKEKSKNFTSWLFGGNQKEKRQTIMSDQEAEALDKEIQQSVQEIGGPANQLTVGIQVLFKDAIFDAGITNDQGFIEGIRLFASDIKASFLQLKNSSSPDLTFDLMSSINDFGVDLYQFDPSLSLYKIQDSIIISNKKINKFGGDDQWKIRVRKRPEDCKDIDFDIELNVNPFLLMYQKEFVKRAILISKVKINQQAQNAAIDKIEDIREATSNSIYQLLYKKANRFRFNIASPVIVLPLTADKNPTSPVWVLRLGDLKIESQESQLQTTSIMEYEKYRLMLDSVRLKYYQTFDHWERLVARVYNLRELTATKVDEKNDITFSVIEDCSMQLDVAIKQKKGGGLLIMTADQRKEYQKKPKIQIKGTSSDIKINLTHSLYNKLVNLGDIFDNSSIDEIQQPREQEQIESKQQLLSKAKKVGQVQKRLYPLNQWENYFCILSESHLYFYKDGKQVMPASNFYFKGASIVENSHEISLKNTISLKNRFGECCICLKNEIDMKDWINKIKTALYEQQAEEEQALLARQLQSIDDNYKQEDKIKKRKKDINHEAVASQFQFEVPLFKTLLVDELRNHSDWILFNFSELSVQKIKLKSSSNISLRVKEISLVDLTMPINSSLIGKKQVKLHNQKVEYDALQISIQSLEKYNPEYLGIDTVFDIKMNNLFIKMQPNTINEVIKFVRNTKPGCSFNLIKKEKEESGDMDFEEQKMEHNNLNQTEIQINNSLIQLDDSVVSSKNQPQNQVGGALQSCQNIREIKSQFNVQISNVSLSLLHQEYNMEIYRIDSSLLEIQYSKHYDHMVFGIKFKDASIFDLTGYPYTINPKEFADNPTNFFQAQREMTSMKPSNTDGYALDLRYEGYDPTCALKKKGYGSKINLTIRPITVEFFNESFMRFFSYFFEQFLNALTLTDPYNNPEQEELEKLKRRRTLRKETIKKLVDFQQQTEIIEMDIKIFEFAINIPDRPQSRNQLSLQINEFRVSQQIKLKAGRVQMNKEKELWAKSFRMEIDKAKIIYGGDTALTDEPFNMSILFENLANSPILAKLDPKIVDQSTYLRIQFDPVLLTIKQKVYTMILRILDLNINYTDFLEREYYFLRFVLMEEYFKSLENIVGMRMKIEFKCLALKLEHVDNTFVSELMLQNFIIKMTKFRDLKGLMEVDIQNFFVLDQPQPEKFYKKNMNELLKLLSPEDCVIQPKSIQAALVQTDKKLFQKKEQHQLNNQVCVIMKMHPNGEKDMKIDIKGLRISIKPHVLLMVQNFFLNSFPEYDQLSIDKPCAMNYDPEKAPKMDIKVLTKECLLVFQNRPGLKTLACHGDITFELGKQNIKEIKKLLDQNGLHNLDENALNPDRPQHQQQQVPRIRKNTSEFMQFEEGANAIDDAPQIDRKKMMMAPSKVVNDIAYYMLVKIDKFCPFVCSLSQLNEQKSFDKIKKRQLMNNFCFSYSYKGHIIKVPKLINQNTIYEFGANIMSYIEFSKLKAKISIQDMILMNQIVDFANYNIINEYQKKLDIINQINKNLNNSKIYDGKLKLTQIQNNQDNQSPLKMMDAEENEDDENLLDSLNQQYQKSFTSEIQRLRSTTMALQTIAQKLNVVENKKKLAGVKKSKIRQQRKDKSILEGKKQDNNNQSLIIDTKNQMQQNIYRKTHLSRLQDNPNQQGVFFSASNNPANKPRDTVVGTILDGKPKESLIEEENKEEDEAQRLDTDVFYSANDPRETVYMNANQFAQNPIIFDQEEDTEIKMQGEPSNGVLTQQEKMHLEIQVKEVVKFENALENIISNRQNIKSEGIQIIFINDYDDVFCPVIEIDIAEASMESSTEKGMNKMKADLPRMRVNYFNPHISDQEPFIESFSVIYTYEESQSALQSKQILTTIDFPTPIWINMTDQCFENIIETYYSWMESPAYQYDDFNKIHKKESLKINPPVIRSAIGSLNESQSDNQNGAGLLKKTKDKSKSESINDDLDEMILDDENQSIIERIQDIDTKIINADHFNKVSPYSIRNLTCYPIKVIKKQRGGGQLEENNDNNTNYNDSFYDKQNNNQLSILQQSEQLEVEPNQIVQYTVDLDNDDYDIFQNMNKKQNGVGDSPHKARERHQSVRINQDLKKLNKNQEVVSIIFEAYEDIKDIDLNKIDQKQDYLKPKVIGELLQFDNQSPQRRFGSSTVMTEEDATNRFSTKKDSETRKRKKGDKYVVPNNFEKIMYGVVLKKMRKTLTIRQEYVLSNNTKFNFLIKIAHQFDKSVYKTYIVKSDCQFGINSHHYKNYNLSFKIEKKIDLMPDDQIGFDEERSSLIHQTDSFSEEITIESLTRLNLEQGIICQHDDSLYTYLRKQKGEIINTFDIVMIPPVSIKNCLPCKLEIITPIEQGQGYQNEETKQTGQCIEFDKQDEKQFHIFNYLDINKDTLYLKFRISGFIESVQKFKRKTIGIDADEDIDIKIMDKDAIANSIGIKLLQKKAGFQLIFYAHTVILNHSNFQLGYHQNSLNKQDIGGQHAKHEMCIFSKEESFLVSIGTRYSPGIQIKNIGLTDYFSIQAPDNTVSLTHDDENRPFNKIGNDRTMSRGSQITAHEKRFDFVYQTYLSLVSDQESVYTKIIQIAPRYIIVNKSIRTFSLAQTGNEVICDSLQPGERKEWFWHDFSNDHKIVIKLDDQDNDQSISQKKWLWSSPIDIKEAGTESILLLQDVKRFNNKDSEKIIKISKKGIEGSNYVILEEEDDVHPQYRIENRTSRRDGFAVWYVQKDIPLYTEGQQLLPMSYTPFAFQDISSDKPTVQIYVTKSLEPLNAKAIDLHTDGTVVSFNNFNFQQILTLHNPEVPGQLYQVKVSVCTDGYSKIVRISDKTTDDQDITELQQIKLDEPKKKNPKESNQKEEEGIKSPEEKKPKVDVTNIMMKVSINEILVSFVSKITERKENNEMVSSRKEIALLTIQDINIDRMQFNKQNIENNKLRIMKIQLDNMSSITPMFPTVIQPMIYRNRETDPMIDFALDLRLENPDLTYIENLDFKFSGIVVKLDDRFLGYCMTFVMELQEKTKTNFTGLHPMFINQGGNPRVSLAQNKVLMAEGSNVKEILIKDSEPFGCIGNQLGVISVQHVSNAKRNQALMADSNRMSNRTSNRMSNRSSVRSSTSSAESLSGQDDARNDENEQYKSWKSKKIDSLNKRIFIKDCKMSSVKVEISFLVRKSVKKLAGKGQQSQLNKQLDSWGLAVFNVDQVPIKVRPFIRLQLFGTQDTIIALISDHFINNIKRNILKLLFSFAIFGNPRKLVSAVSKGLYDFKTMPFQGEGVGGFVRGSANGTVSLFKNTFEGAFGVVESFSGGLSKLALVLNQDEDYLGTREEKIITEKPRNLVEGVGFGCQTAIDSLVAAGLGVIKRPYIEAKRNGFKGFFQGIYSGTTGLILKPISGGLDLISKSAEGIINTVKIFEAQIFNDRRRLPRVFYGNREIIKPYNELDSYIQGRILNSIDDPNQFKNDRYLEAIPYQQINDKEKTQRTMLLVLTEEHLLLLDAAQKSLKWFVNNSQIGRIDKFKNGLVINLKEKQETRDKVAIEIDKKNAQIIQSVYDKIFHLQKQESTK